ncbi:ATP-binding protein [Streptomyces albus]|nr:MULTISPECIES: ATP-binding protein [Streptomyces]EPD90553.1 hypothetical protein HMPREF1486_05914 [Streptomyces sp. HPH0547]QID36655.1 ATP-binding protein [Streptomyces albus]UVN56485.1 ATP-binding protein [Streptomyces albus]GHJ22355.1 hypothetical protein TPA0909_39690 [Streptomyces albus]
MNVAAQPPRTDYQHSWPLLAARHDIGEWRHKVGIAARALGADHDAVHVARLGVTELLGNVCKHVAEPQCQLVVAVEGEVLCVRLFDRSHEAPRVTTPDHLAESGRGLWLLRELAFDIGYTLTTGGKWVWLHCALNAGTAVSRAAHGCDLGSSSTTPSRR